VYKSANLTFHSPPLNASSTGRATLLDEVTVILRAAGFGDSEIGALELRDA